MPEPMTHISASAVRDPVLPARARGFTSGALSIQKERVALETGNDSDAGCGGGEKMAWNGSCKVTCENAAKLCRPTRQMASNWWWNSVMMVIEATRGHCNKYMRPNANDSAGKVYSWPKKFNVKTKQNAGRLAQLVRASC